MSDAAAKVEVPQNLGPFLLDPLNHAIAAGTRKALDVGIPTHSIIEMHLNQLTSVIAMVHPVGARAECIQDVVKAIPVLVNKYVDKINTTPGGIKLPGAM